jgi:HPt (histidine-containing phosphotransfer) domain-containing protein
MNSDIVARLWEQFRPLVAQRLQLLQSYADGDGSVDREDARQAAHNLAGALGSYGRPQGSEIARRIELGLTAGAPESLTAADLGALLGRLRQIVED